MDANIGTCGLDPSDSLSPSFGVWGSRLGPGFGSRESGFRLNAAVHLAKHRELQQRFETAAGRRGPFWGHIVLRVYVFI